MARDPRTPRRPCLAALPDSAIAVSLRRLAAVAAALAALPILSPARDARAQDAARPSQVTIAGTVVDAVTGQPISGVVVEVRGVGFRLQTDTDGGFTLSRIPVGDYQLELTHPGYHPVVGDFTVMRSGEFVTTMEPVFTGSDDLLTGIVGVVSDGADGRPIGGVTVRSTNARRGMLTDPRGRFSLTELSPGLHVVEFVQLGYVSRRDSIQVMPGRVTNVRASLSVDPVQMDPIEVTVERREVALQEVGFYRRENEGFGDFIDREHIEQQAPGQMSDLFTRLPGVDTRPDPGNPFEKHIMLRGGRSENCFPRVIMDGVVVGRGGDEPAMLDRLLDPSAVAGVEVYVSQSGVPAQYMGTGVSCGLIIIWTRR